MPSPSSLGRAADLAPAFSGALAVDQRVIDMTGTDADLACVVLDEAQPCDRHEEP